MPVLNSPILYHFVQFHDAWWDGGSAPHCVLLLWPESGGSPVPVIPALYEWPRSILLLLDRRLSFQLGSADTGWKDVTEWWPSLSHTRVSLLKVGDGSLACCCILINTILICGTTVSHQWGWMNATFSLIDDMLAGSSGSCLFLPGRAWEVNYHLGRTDTTTQGIRTATFTSMSGRVGWEAGSLLTAVEE